MKYVLTGSVGNISKPIAITLIEAGHQVSIISSKAGKETDIKALGAIALTGSVEDVYFLSEAFKGADAVYLMIPPNWSATNFLDYQQKVADNYIQALAKNSIKNVVVLSSIGAHMGKGAGPVDGLAYLESKLNQLPEVNAVYLRPSYFYYNLLSMIPLIKNAGIMGSNQPADFKLVLVHPTDIAAVAAKKLLDLDFTGKQVCYIGGDERTWTDITATLSGAVGKENVPWVEFTDEQSLNGMLHAGLPETIANAYTTMGIALRSGEMQSDYWKQHPHEMGKVKLEEFATEFAEAFNK